LPTTGNLVNVQNRVGRCGDSDRVGRLSGAGDRQGRVDEVILHHVVDLFVDRAFDADTQTPEVHAVTNRAPQRRIRIHVGRDVERRHVELRAPANLHAELFVLRLDFDAVFPDRVHRSVFADFEPFRFGGRGVFFLDLGGEKISDDRADMLIFEIRVFVSRRGRNHGILAAAFRR
jgi:hypothetical protein